MVQSGIGKASVKESGRDTGKDRETEQPRLQDAINKDEQVAPQMADPENPQIYFYATDGSCQCAQVMSAQQVRLTRATKLCHFCLSCLKSL